MKIAMNKKSHDLPQPPSLPTEHQILEDLKSSDLEDPVFYESTEMTPSEVSVDSFHVAKEFMITTSKLRDLKSSLTLERFQLQKNYEELRIMSENIRQQATEALSNIY